MALVGFSTPTCRADWRRRPIMHDMTLPCFSQKIWPIIGLCAQISANHILIRETISGGAVICSNTWKTTRPNGAKFPASSMSALLTDWRTWSSQTRTGAAFRRMYKIIRLFGRLQGKTRLELRYRVFISHFRSCSCRKFEFLEGI